MPIPWPQDARSDPSSGRVLQALEATRRGMRRYQSAMALTMAGLVAIAVGVVVVVLDLAWVLPTWARAVGLASMVGGALGAVALGRLGSARRFAKGNAAAEVESSFPELGQRVRTTLEYAEPNPRTAPALSSLVRALALDADRRAHGLDFAAIIPWKRWAARALGLALTMIGVAAALATDPDCRIAARRLFLGPAHYSTLAVKPGDSTIREGSDFRLTASVGGRPVPSARWLRRPVGSHQAWSTGSLTSIASPGREPGPVVGSLEGTWKDCRDDFEYRVVAGELESDVYRVKVTHPLILTSIEARIEPPAYLKLAPSVAKDGNFRAPEGSKVRLRFGLDRSPTSAKLTYTLGGSKSPVEVSPSILDKTLEADMPPLTKDVHYEIAAISKDGMTLEPLRFQIEVDLDEKPSLRFEKPAEALAATPTTEIPIKVVAGDDHGLTRVGITYQVGDGPEESLYLEHPETPIPSIEALATLYLEKHKLTLADTLSYRAFAEDNKEPTRQKVATELRFVDILPYKQAYQLGESGPPSNGSSVTLEELIVRQRQTLNRTLAHEDDRPVDPKVADRLSKDEAQLALIAGDFAARLGDKFGPINPLLEAARLMEAATSSLAETDFVLAIAQERSALTSLTQARRNLRKLLADAKSAGEMKKLDLAQQQQKLRPSSTREKSQAAERAKLERDLKALAQDQARFAEGLESKSSRGGEASKEASRLKEVVDNDPTLTALARSRMERAAADVKKAEEAARTDRSKDAARSARDAAEGLDRLAEQVAALHEQELASKLAKARDLASATSDLERQLASRGTPSSPAGVEQTRLIEDVKTLGDLLERLESEAKEEDRTAARAIESASAANSPSEIEEVLRGAALAHESGEAAKSARAMGEAASKLEALALDLETARRDHMQPKLQQLLALESQASEARKALESASGEVGQGKAEKALADLSKAANALKNGDGPVRQAAEALAQVTQGGASSRRGRPSKSGSKAGFQAPPAPYTEAVVGLSLALQARIRELILGDVRVARDGVVPARYKEKVDDYFRLLSEDLR